MELGPQVQTGVLQHAYLPILIRAEQKATGFSLYPMVIGLAILPTSLIEWFLWEQGGACHSFRLRRDDGDALDPGTRGVGKERLANV